MGESKIRFGTALLAVGALAVLLTTAIACSASDDDEAAPAAAAPAALACCNHLRQPQPPVSLAV